MQVFIYIVQLPANIWEERTIKSIEPASNDIIHWNIHELDSRFSGEFGWKKIGLFGICALQYMNKNSVRLLVKANSQQMADSMVKSFAWHLDAKKENKRPYARRCANMKRIMVANSIATTNSMSLLN